MLRKGRLVKKLFSSLLVFFFLTPAAFAGDVYQAMEAIVNYQREMEDVFNRHEEVFIDGDLLKNLMIDKGIPYDEFSRTPELLSPFKGSWYASDLGFAGGPGDYGRDYCRKFLNPENPRNLHGSFGVLRKSYDYLMSNRDRYLNRPPDAEMAHMRAGMNKWRQHVKAYHEALVKYMEVYAQFMSESFYGGLRNSRLKQELDAEYQDRYKNSKRDAEFKIKKAELEKDYEQEKAKSEVTKQKMKQMHASLMEMTKVFMFRDLGEEFGKRFQISDLNKEYMNLKAKLKNLKGDERKKAEARLKELEGKIRAEASSLEKEFGPNWKDFYREPSSRKLPGGLLEDDPATKLKIFANEKYGKNYQIGGETPKAEEEINLYEADPYVASGKRKPAPVAQESTQAAPPPESILDDVDQPEKPAPPAESILDDVDQPEKLTPPAESILDDVDQEADKPRTPTQAGQDLNAAAAQGLAENKPENWEQQAAAGMDAVIEPGKAENVPAKARENLETQNAMRVNEQTQAESSDLARRMQTARAQAAEQVRRERMEASDRVSLEKRRDNALDEVKRYEEKVHDKMKAEGRERMTDDELAEYESRSARYSELMQPTPEEETEMAKYQSVRDGVNQDLDRFADKMGGTDEASVAERAQNAAEANAATSGWRDLTFTGKISGQVTPGMVRSREQGIAANNKVIAAQKYLERKDLTPEQRAAANQYLARALTERGKAAEAISRDSAVILTAAAGDVVTLAAGGSISRGASKIREAVTAGEAASSASSSSAAAAAAEDGLKTQIIPNAGKITTPEATATTRMFNPQAPAAQEAGAATTRMFNPQAPAAQEAAAATTRIMPPKTVPVTPSKPLSEMTKAERQAYNDALANEAVKPVMKPIEEVRKTSGDAAARKVEDMWRAAEEGESILLPEAASAIRSSGQPAGELSKHLTQAEVEALFKPGANLTRDQIMQKADLFLANRVPPQYRGNFPPIPPKAPGAADAAQDLTATQIVPKKD